MTESTGDSGDTNDSTTVVSVLSHESRRALPSEPWAHSRWAGMGFLTLVLALLVSNGIWIAQNSAKLRPVSPGDVAPIFELAVIDHHGARTGERIALEDLRGRPVLVDFWASWCGPCRASMPHIEQLYQRYKHLGRRGLAVVSIKTDGPTMGKAASVIAQTTFPIVLDGGSVANRYKVTNIPHLVLVDPMGVVSVVHRGGGSFGELADRIDEMLGPQRVEQQ